jgi:predicted acetyltransferase
VLVSTDAFEIRPIRPDEFDALYHAMRYAFHESQSPGIREAERSVFECDRSLAVFDGDQLVGSAAVYTRDLTVPGGPLPVACVSAVAVAATHTRRGLLNRLMRRQLTELHDERREPVAALWASESAIYGRYGYGLAARHARLELNTREVRLAAPVPPAARRLRLGEASDPKLRAELAAVLERVRPGAVGHVDRRDAWWDFVLLDLDVERGGGLTTLRTVVHDGAAGPDGYALFRVRDQWGARGPEGEVAVQEVVTETPAAYRALWSFLFDTDLVNRITCRVSPTDTPLAHLVDHPRRIAAGLGDNLWIRLVDVDRALAARRYAAPVGAVFEVTDRLCPWNEGRWRLRGDATGARCERTDDAADLSLTSTELGAAYLGGTTLATLAATGRVTELRPGALRAASTAFAEPRPPYCPEVF